MSGGGGAVTGFRKNTEMHHAPSPSRLFITGMLRSGTTLLENLINTHNPARVLYQPCMPLFTGVKNAFLASLGHDPARYPLGPLFPENRYTPDDFLSFLSTYRPSTWPGIPTKIDAEKQYAGSLADILPRFWSVLGSEKESPVLGAKEVLCEEYTPYLARQGFRTIIVLRDPRDVITSMNYGGGNRYAGEIRPTLYNVRIWRKSVAFALHLVNLGLGRFVRYEDLVRDTEAQTGAIMSWLGVSVEETLTTLRKELLDDQGQRWSGNSSFEEQAGVSANSVGRFKDLLPADLITYIETLCEPEMKALGYIIELEKKNTKETENSISSFDEPLPVTHPAVPADYSTSKNNILQEKRRIELLTGSDREYDSEIQQLFIFDDVFETLRGAGCGK